MNVLKETDAERHERCKMERIGSINVYVDSLLKWEPSWRLLSVYTVYLKCAQY